jgi:hypothetical protein
MPKCAGGTWDRSLAAHPSVVLCRSGDELPARQDGKTVWFLGHSVFGLHAVYDAEPHYAVILRQPIDRLISEFFYSAAQPDTAEFLSADDRLDAFCRLVGTAPHLNYYCAMLSMMPCFEPEGGWDGTPRAVLALVRRYRARHGFLTQYVPFDRTPDDLLARATDSLSGFSFVGRYEDIVAAAADFTAAFGVPIDLGVRLHVTAAKPALPDLPEQTQRLLWSKTELDRALYAFAASGRMPMPNDPTMTPRTSSPPTAGAPTPRRTAD